MGRVVALFAGKGLAVGVLGGWLRRSTSRALTHYRYRWWPTRPRLDRPAPRRRRGRGPLMHDRAGLGDTAELTPALWWPQDRSWCVATEVDDDVTYVAGPTELIDHLHRDPRLETQTAAEAEPELLDLPEDWLAELLVPAARRLLSEGEAEVATALGSLLCRLHAEPEQTGVLEIGVVGHARWSDQPTRVPLAEDGKAAVPEIVTALRRALSALLY